MEYITQTKGAISLPINQWTTSNGAKQVPKNYGTTSNLSC